MRAPEVTLLKKAFGVLAVAIGMVVVSAKPADASLIGLSVLGEINFGGPGPNFFDPANGFVPAGFLNTASATVVIADPAQEFGFQDGANRDTADFTGTQLIVTDQVFTGAANWIMRFTSAGFAGARLTELVDSFPSGGVTATVVGNVITLTWAGTNAPGSFRAVYDVAAVPEPGTMLLVGSGLAAALRARRRARR
jgi:hypothetical protein